MAHPHPVEKAKDLAAEAERGRSPRTPLLALTGVTLFLSILFAILVTIALVLYFVYGGKKPEARLSRWNRSASSVPRRAPGSRAPSVRRRRRRTSAGRPSPRASTP